jgi:hypothetical protein
MNADDRRYLERVSDVLCALPLPCAAGGTQSQSVGGFVSFGMDGSFAKPLIEKALLLVRSRGLPQFDELDQQDLDEALARLEAFVVRRRAEDWCEWVHRSLNSRRADYEIGPLPTMEDAR